MKLDEVINYYHLIMPKLQAVIDSGDGATIHKAGSLKSVMINYYAIIFKYNNIDKLGKFYDSIKKAEDYLLKITVGK